MARTTDLHCIHSPAPSRHLCCRQEQAAAADELESAADERRGCEQQLLQHARASSRDERRRSEALAGQLQRVQARAAQLVQQCQVEREVCSTAQQLVEELQAAHNAAVGEAQEERQQREALLAHLQSIQVRMCGMATPAAPQR
jgi:chromosome segregation ATPase